MFCTPPMHRTDFHISQPFALERLRSSVNLYLNTFIDSDILSRQIQSQFITFLFKCKPCLIYFAANSKSFCSFFSLKSAQITDSLTRAIKDYHHERVTEQSHGQCSCNYCQGNFKMIQPCYNFLQ